MVPRKAAQDTAEALLSAARDEFARAGYGGTDTNKIARRAGFAPQTFYRWYHDKTEIFVAVYRRWEEDEREVLTTLIAKRASTRRLVDAIVEHHREHLEFRRSLRQLSVQDDVVRRARAESRLRQVEHIRSSHRREGARGGLEPSPASTQELAVVLLQIERLADAIAEGELADLGMDESAARAALVALLKRIL